jgi:hypothetical protein
VRAHEAIISQRVVGGLPKSLGFLMIMLTRPDDFALLLELGQRLDDPAPGTQQSVRDLLAVTLLRVRDKHGRLVPLRPNRAQAEFSRRCGRRNLVLKARQLGITTWVAARFFLATITRPGTLSVQVAHDQRSAEEIFRIVHRFLENLPEALRKGALATARANVRQVVFQRLDSEYRVETAADPNAGRGLTIRHLHASEVARWPRDAAETLASLRAAVPPDGEIVLESTPAGAAGCFYQEWERAADTGYVQHFFPWWWEPEYVGAAPVAAADYTEEERDLVERFGLSGAQIAFRREIRASFRGLAAQEFAEDPVSCFLASNECVFEVAAIEKRLAEFARDAAQPEFTPGAALGAAELRDNGRLAIWWPPRAGSEYIIGVDPAGGGVQGDFACAQVIERTSGLQCAELYGHFTPPELAARVAALGHEYHDALIAVERNNHGHGVLAYLGAVQQYPRIYQQKGQAGWLTTSVSRPPMIELFGTVIARHADLLSSPRLLAECRTFVRHLDGTAAAAAGAHDDCVMAMAIAHAVRNELASRPGRKSELELASL